LEILIYNPTLCFKKRPPFGKAITDSIFYSHFTSEADQATQQFAMQILVQGAGGGIRAFTMKASDTLGRVKLSLLQSIANANNGIDINNRGKEMGQFYFSCGGKALADNCRLMDMDIGHNSLIQLIPRVCGGGGDGGATGAESRDCYLKMYAEKKPDKVDPNETRISKWSTCALSQETLKPPCAIDRLGNVFNKESLVRALLDKTLPSQFSHIRGLKDMIAIQLDPIPGVRVYHDGSETKFQCPITSFEFNGKYKFFALERCGHVLSAKALKELQSTSCLVCHAVFSESEKIVINGNEEEVAALRLKMEQDRANVREKKQKKTKNGVVLAGGIALDKNGQKDDAMGQSVDRASGIHDKVSGIHAKRKGEESRDSEDGNGEDKAKAALKKFKAIDHAPAHASKEVYASIFTSSKKSDFKETYSCRALPLGRN
jgi:hypothetical protein